MVAMPQASKVKLLNARNILLSSAVKDNGFRLYLQEMNILSPDEFKVVIADPNKKGVMVDLYKDYLDHINDPDRLPF
tara:strand:+ start:60 stop:290 length:231 start_codon:yes stop_codon:yes gene_type:complete